jgi:hypothetical protein
LRRAAAWLIRVVLVLLAAVALTRCAFSSAAGIAAQDAIPLQFWTAYHRAFGLEQQGSVERLQDADALPIVVACFLIALGVTALAELVGRRILRAGDRSRDANAGVPRKPRTR